LKLVAVAKSVLINETFVEDASKVCDYLHSKGPTIVIITSFCFNISSSSNDDQNMISVMCSDASTHSKRLYQVKRYGGYYSGTGDLFAALFLSWYHKSGGNVDQSIRHTLGSLSAVISSTYQSNSIELLIIPCRQYLEYPPNLPDFQSL
jgi:pyridoxine kinase